MSKDNVYKFRTIKWGHPERKLKMIPDSIPHTRSNIRSTSISMSSASRRMLPLQAQAIPPRRNPLRKDRPKLPRRRHARSHHLMDAISVRTN
jgi:hypothetical protein